MRGKMPMINLFHLLPDELLLALVHLSGSSVVMQRLAMTEKLMAALFRNKVNTVAKLGSHVFCQCSLHGNQVLQICKILKLNMIITTLKLHHLGPRGAIAIAEVLKVNSVLTTLDVSKNSIGGYCAVDAAIFVPPRRPAIAKVAKALQDNAVLTSLDVGYNNLTEEAALSIVRVERQRNKLTSLGLAGCYIGASGAAVIAEFLTVTAILTTLNIAENRLCGVIYCNGTYTDVGIIAIAEALKINATVTSLNLSHNSIGHEGANEIANAIKFNSVVTTLDLSCNFGAPLGVMMAEVLEVNTVLKNLQLRMGIDNEGGAAIAEALEVNSVLTKLNLQYNFDISDTTKRALKDVVSGREGFELDL